MAETMEIKVEGMGCQGCVTAVEKAVKSLSPAAEVAVDLSSGLVSVGNAAAPRAAIEGAIEKAGYDIAR